MCNYSRKITTTIILFILAFNSFAQNSKKESINRHRQLTKLTFEKLKTQSYSELAREFTIEEFLSYYIENGKEKVSKKYGTEFIDSLYSDSTYSYYLHRTNYPIDLIKVKIEDIKDINISEIDGNQIRQKFIDEIVPKNDKDRAAKKSKNCSMGSDYWDFKYNYDKKTRLVAIEYKWKISCDFIRIINKTYNSNYSLDKKTFQN